MFFKTKKKPKSILGPIKEDLLNYMKKKYNEEFTAGLCQPAGWYSTADSMGVYSDNFPEEVIDVIRNKDGIYSDNYLGFIHRAENDRRMQAIADPIYGKCKVLTKRGQFTLPIEFDKNTSFEKYIQASYIGISVHIFVDASERARDFEQCFEALTQKLKEQNTPYDIYVNVLREGISLEEVNKNNFMTTLCDKKKCLAQGEYAFSGITEFRVIQNDWEEFEWQD